LLLAAKTEQLSFPPKTPEEEKTTRRSPKLSTKSSPSKVSKYGKEFVGLLRKELGLKREKGDTYAETLMLLMQNYSIEEIASARDLKPVTVYSHIAWLIKEKKFTEWHRFLTVYEIEAVAGALKNVNYTGELKPIYEALNEEIDYGKIRLAIAVLGLENE